MLTHRDGCEVILCDGCYKELPQGQDPWIVKGEGGEHPRRDACSRTCGLKLKPVPDVRRRPVVVVDEEGWRRWRNPGFDSTNGGPVV